MQVYMYVLYLNINIFCYVLKPRKDNIDIVKILESQTCIKEQSLALEGNSSSSDD